MINFEIVSLFSVTTVLNPSMNVILRNQTLEERDTIE